MTLSAADIAALADRVQAAQRDARAMPRLTDDYPTLDVAGGYAVQDELRRRWQAAGHRIVGHKAGLTSKAKMAQMGVDVPSFAFLGSDMARPENGVVAVSELIHPRVEAEIAFVLARPLRGPHCTVEQVLAATDFIAPALEVIDSRFSGFKFDLPSVIADNGSSARFACGGRPRRPAEVDLPTLGVVIERNGEIVATAAAAAVLGHPARAVAMLADHLGERGEELPAGALVLTGAITEAFAVSAGDFVTARIQDLGSVSLRFA